MTIGIRSGCLVLSSLLLAGCGAHSQLEPARLYVSPRPATDTIGLPFSGAVQIGLMGSPSGGDAPMSAAASVDGTGA